MAHFIFLIGLVVGFFEVPAVGQGNPMPPPSVVSRSPGGVSFGSGTYSSEFPDLSVGNGSAAGGLDLMRSYDSGVPHGFSAYAGFGAQGWSHNWFGRITVGQFPTYPGLDPYNCNSGVFDCEMFTAIYYHNVVLSNRSVKFQNGNAFSNTGNNVGVYQPLEDDGLGTSLVFSGAHHSGNFVFTDRDGTQYHFLPLSSPSGPALSYIVYPDGTRHDLNYLNGNLRSVFSNKGYALLFEYSASAPNFGISKICAVNRSVDEVTTTSACPGTAASVSFTYASSPIVYHNGSVPNTVLSSATDAIGNVTNFRYDDGGHLDCIKKPGQAVCAIVNIYSQCFQDPDYGPQSPSAKYPELHLSEQVLSQQMATGEAYTYSFAASRICPEPSQFLQSNGGLVYMDDATAARTTVQVDQSKPTSITDPLNRVSQMAYRQSFGGPATSSGFPAIHTFPDGDRYEYTYDGSGNRTEVRRKPKSGSGLADIVTAAAYDCVNKPKSCSKPVSTTDAKGQVTTYTYDSAHGGVLTETGPVVNGVAPQKRYEYAQRYAWTKNGGGYIQSAAPIWLVTRERYCRTTAPAGASCVGGVADEVLTDYDYGPNSGPNTLLLRGVTVTADGQTLRTCYGYDTQGRKISETKPAANLSACP